MTPQEMSALKTAWEKNADVRDRALALKHQLERIHQDQIMRPLSEAIGAETSSIRRLMDLAKGMQPRDLDPAEIDAQAETTREVYDEWSRGR